MVYPKLIILDVWLVPPITKRLTSYRWRTKRQDLDHRRKTRSHVCQLTKRVYYTVVYFHGDMKFESQKFFTVIEYSQRSREWPRINSYMDYIHDKSKGQGLSYQMRLNCTGRLQLYPLWCSDSDFTALNRFDKSLYFNWNGVRDLVISPYLGWRTLPNTNVELINRFLTNQKEKWHWLRRQSRQTLFKFIHAAPIWGQDAQTHTWSLCNFKGPLKDIQQSM